MHSFHIPVMGIGFTLETPMKVSHYGMDSALSLVDDILIEKVRKLYTEIYDLPYEKITNKMEDFRAKRITAYLNLVQTIVVRKFDEVKSSISEKRKGFQKYFDMLPEGSQLLKEYNDMLSKIPSKIEIEDWLKEKLSLGSIDVNIMTKVDGPNYKNGEALSAEYNDAHAALRGFANSDLSSAVILSAGMNPRLYGYISQFEDFYPDESGYVKKRIILKVSDYRSAIIQGKFLAKKGLWVSEYRIESGLNCGGHAFATEGYLMGPVLSEFRDKKQELIESTFELLSSSLKSLDKVVPLEPMGIKITAQGGVGTGAEHKFLLDHYNLDSIGWGSPFLLVPEATTMDELTLEKLEKAKEEDLFLSGISPLGVPFNNLKKNTKDGERDANIAKDRPGSSCPKKFVSVNTEFTERPICTASREYQNAKIRELKELGLSPEEFEQQHSAITEKSCICVGLGTGTLLHHGLDTKKEGTGVSVCPGPNMAYFDRSMELSEITDHIYGRTNVITRKDRPHMFIKELSIYMDFLKDKIGDIQIPMNRKDLKYFSSFTKNMKEGIGYYKNLFSHLKEGFTDQKEAILLKLESYFREVSDIEEGIK